jgi:hypothetical protein
VGDVPIQFVTIGYEKGLRDGSFLKLKATSSHLT